MSNTPNHTTTSGSGTGANTILILPPNFHWGIGAIPEVESEPEMTKFKVECVARNVNTKRIVNELLNNITESVNDLVCRVNVSTAPTTFTLTSPVSAQPQRYDMSDVVTFIELLLNDMVMAGDVVNFDVMCDERNNTDKMSDNNIFQIDVSFKQFNCLNITKLQLTISPVTS